MKQYKIEPFENLVEAFNALPGIGRKTAIRLAYHIAVEDGFSGVKLSQAIEDAVERVHKCANCHNMSEDELCSICADPSRDRSKLCIVQSSKDILSIEESGQYDGVYYVISKLEDMDEMHLLRATEGVEEVIFAFPPSIATDTMILYIEEKLSDKGLVFSKIAQGVPTGVELENVDVISLGRAFEARVRV